MTGEERDRRDSRALEPELVTDPQAKAVAEARNGFRQYDAAMGTVHTALDRGSFKLRPSLILGLQREALVGISSYAGNYRPGGVAIEGSKHEPVGAHLVPELVEDMCDYINDHWNESTPIHLASYVMWRLNWIHPFADGNGTDVAYRFVRRALNSRGFGLARHAHDPRSNVDNRKPYFDALDAADLAFRDGHIDVSKMEELLGSLLANQLAQFYKSVGGKLPG
jgi:fido (protein-threonine AMPylation protein)